MSYYYNYYIGYQTSDKKIYPLGPYDNKGKLHNVFYRSRSFASDLHNDMYVANEDEYSDELKNEFSYEDWDGKTQYENIKYLPISELPSENYIKSGFFLIEDITEYEKLKEENEWASPEDLFYDKMTPMEFIMRLQHELVFGKYEPKKDDEGNEFPSRSAANYAYYSYPDYCSKEYECHMLRMAAVMYEFCDLPEGARIVVLETEG